MEQQNHSRKDGSVQITLGLYVELMAEHGPRPAGSKAMMDKESPAGSWKQAIEWMKQVKNDAPVADRPNADDYRNRAGRMRRPVMKFDLHGELANQITIENLKWHLASMEGDIQSGVSMHPEDAENYTATIAALREVLDYFGVPS